MYQYICTFSKQYILLTLLIDSKNMSYTYMIKSHVQRNEDGTAAELFMDDPVIAGFFTRNWPSYNGTQIIQMNLRRW